MSSTLLQNLIKKRKSKNKVPQKPKKQKRIPSHEENLLMELDSVNSNLYPLTFLENIFDFLTDMKDNSPIFNPIGQKLEQSTDFIDKLGDIASDTRSLGDLVTTSRKTADAVEHIDKHLESIAGSMALIAKALTSKGECGNLEQ